MGDVSTLYPDEVTDVKDLPFTIFHAILHGIRFLSYEEWPTEDRPPKRIWMDGEALKEHFETVDQRRKDRAKGDDIEDSKNNAAARSLLVG